MSATNSKMAAAGGVLSKATTDGEQQIEVLVATASCTKPFQCGTCGHRTTVASNMIQHIATHTGVRRENSSSVTMATAVSTPGEKMAVADGDEPCSEMPQHSCPLCEFAATDQKQLESHALTHATYEGKPFMCGECKYRTSSLHTLQMHMKTHTDGSPLVCKDCGYKTAFKYRFEKHLRTHIGEKNLACGECEFSATRKLTLERHNLEAHTCEEKHECEIYGFRASSENDMAKHVGTHLGEKLYPCEECEYIASRKCNLDRHMRTHTGEKPFKCEECDYRAAQKSTIKSHMKTHRARTKSCTMKRTKKHKKACAKVRCFMCAKCGYQAAHKCMLVRHARTHTGEKPYACEECEYRTAWKGNLRKHVDTHHTGDQPLTMLGSVVVMQKNDDNDDEDRDIDVVN